MKKPSSNNPAPFLDSNSLSRNEKLKSKKLIQRLFNQGTTITAGFMRAVYLITPLPSTSPVQTSFAVARREHRKAVVRNKIKRRMKESFRLNKTSLYKSALAKDEQLALMLIYRGNTVHSYQEINEKIKLILKRLSELHEVNK